MDNRRKTPLALVAVLALGLSVSPPAHAAVPRVPPVSSPAGPCARTLDAYPTLRPGDRRPAVRTLQCALDDLGAHVTVDGYYGPQTRGAVRRIEDGFEGVREHPGRIDSGFWTLLYGRQLPSHVLRQGDRGHAVLVLQRALRAAGGEVTVDGRFGPETRSVLTSYQRAVGVRPTGRFDRDTAFYLAMGAPFG